MGYPLIGITTSRYPNASTIPVLGIPEAYIQSVINAGGVPVMIPLGLPRDQLEALFTRLQGLLLTGGGDIDPVRFAGKPSKKVYGIEPDRDEMELHLVQRAALEGLPYLGICRGFQVVNVAFGGSLYTHILDQHPQALDHSTPDSLPRTYLAHTVEIAPDSRLAQILGSTSHQVNSLHHQGAERIGAGLTPVASAPDGIVEGLEQPDHPFGISVQWHPEWLQEHAPQRALFRAFVDAADRVRPTAEGAS